MAQSARASVPGARAGDTSLNSSKRQSGSRRQGGRRAGDRTWMELEPFTDTDDFSLARGRSRPVGGDGLSADRQRLERRPQARTSRRPSLALSLSPPGARPSYGPDVPPVEVPGDKHATPETAAQNAAGARAVRRAAPRRGVYPGIPGARAWSGARWLRGRRPRPRTPRAPAPAHPRRAQRPALSGLSGEDGTRPKTVRAEWRARRERYASLRAEWRAGRRCAACALGGRGGRGAGTSRQAVRSALYAACAAAAAAHSRGHRNREERRGFCRGVHHWSGVERGGRARAGCGRGRGARLGED